MSDKRKQKERTAESKNSLSRTAQRALSPASIRQPADWRVWLPVGVVVIVMSGWFIFFSLGHYRLWGDEAETAMYARGIARTGDTLALIDHNLYVLRDGALLKNLHGRYVPPASLYVAAPFVGKNGTDTFWPRVPFAVCGLLCVLLLLYWMYRAKLSAASWIVLAIVLLGNTSFYLFSRQCRYYSMATLLTILIAYLYLNWNRRWSGVIWLILASSLLMFTHYLAYAGLYTALACDYLLFGRHDKKLSYKHWIAVLGSQLGCGLFILAFYNPVGAGTVPDIPGYSMIRDRLTLIWWSFRDLNDCEFCVGFVLLAAPAAYFLTRNIWLLRGMTAMVCYCVIISILSPQIAAVTNVYDMRYLSAMLPLCIGLSALVILSLTKYRWILALPLALAIFSSNALNVWENKCFQVISTNTSPLQIHWHCRPVEFAEELRDKRINSTSAVLEWMKGNIKEGQSIWVLPEYMESPLMYHAPQAQYAWHLSSPPKEQFSQLPTIHFFGTAPMPDYFIAFGPFRSQVDNIVNQLKENGVNYQLVKEVDIFWNDAIRPEIFWRSFSPIEEFNRQQEAVYIYKRMPSEQK